MRVALSGSSGFVGRYLARSLAGAGHVVMPMVRTGGAASAGEIDWNPKSGALDPQALADVDAIVHLAGEPIAHRWTRDRKRRIRESRVRGTETIARAMASARDRPRVLLSASAVGIYGNRSDEVLDEGSAPGTDFLATVCTEWERAADPARDAGVRVVHMRTGLVLAESGGAMAMMLPPFRAGLGGPMGSGRQWMSWIAREDFARVVLFLLGADSADGPVNLVAPHPTQNAEFARVLGQVLHRPAVLPVPAFALTLAFGEMAEHTLLASQRVMPRRLGELGFQFRFPQLADALAFELRRDA